VSSGCWPWLLANLAVRGDTWYYSDIHGVTLWKRIEAMSLGETSIKDGRYSSHPLK
jgi:hypothetical protein